MNLSFFLNKNLFEAGTSFFKQLKIPLNSNTTTLLHLKDILKDKFKSQEIFEKVSAACFLGLVDSSVFNDNLYLFETAKLSYEQAGKKIHDAYEGMMIFAVRIDGIDSPTRTQLADLTRALNRASKNLPVIVLFQYSKFITLATSERAKYKQNWREGEKIGKISLLKDIDILNPHTGHIKILDDLALKPGVQDFNGLYLQWREVFDVQLLNRNFYKELSSWYFWAIQHVVFPKDAGEDTEVRNATSVIRLITRLIFIWFVKEKGLVPDGLFDQRQLKGILNYADPNGSTYYKAILQNLFFATLNQEMKPDNRKFRSRNKASGGRDPHYNITNLYRYEDYFRNPAEALALFSQIPFLNGGLFECLDKEDKDHRAKILRIDGFSDRADNEVCVPDFLFFSEEQEVDLNESYGTTNKRYKVCGLIDIFNRYKFTITENTPIEEEVALDPELLGRVFENLLATYNPETRATARKQTGSYYTPREIVNYMVDESLIAYLDTQLKERIPPLQDMESLTQLLREVFAYTEKVHPFNPEEVKALIEAIDDIKILDPACGSGAFPMGILHKLVFILSKLDPNNKEWKKKQLAKADEIPDSTIRDRAMADIEAAFERNELDYGRKLYLIENCIYGVDIQPIAVQIAKLRFFISLVVDQRTDEAQENRGIIPLPNLETKFVAANTLIGLARPQQAVLRNPAIDEKERELTRVRKRHFTARTPQTKRRCREEDRKLRDEIAALLRSDGFPRETTEKLAYWDPYDQNASAEFFDPEWMFGVNRGFDVVIANPPYVDSETMTRTEPDSRALYSAIYKSASGNWDLFIIFIERGIKILKSNGTITYIVPNKLIAARYAETLRKILLEKDVREIRDFSKVNVFKEVAVYPIIFLIQNRDGKNPITMTSMKSLDEVSEQNMIPREIFYKDTDWAKYLAPKTVLQLVLKISSFPPLSQYCKNISGAATVSEAYEIKKHIREMKAQEKQYKQLCNTGTIDRYLILWGKQKTQYLKSSFLKPVLQDEDLQAVNPQRLKQANSEKIIIGGMTKELECAYDRGEFLAGKSTTIILNDSQNRLSLKAVLALLNSALVSFWYKCYFSSLALAGGYLRISQTEIRQIPIPEVPKSLQNTLSNIVETILLITADEDYLQNLLKQAKVKEHETQIDKLVYDLYGLTEEEIRIVEENTGKR